MKRTRNIIILFIIISFASCNDFFNVEQDLVLSEKNLPSDEVELRSMSLGLYALQQELVEQIVVLGELRGDLLKVTKNADADLIEVNNHNISTYNRYASAVGFYRLIAACNKMIHIMQVKYPQVLDNNSTLQPYHYAYGEAVVMRSWAYFNAARIFNEIPYVPETLTGIEEINTYVNSEGTYVDSIYVDYNPDGINHDTIRDEQAIFDSTYVYPDKSFMKQDAMVLRCIKDIKKNVRYEYDEQFKISYPIVGRNYSEGLNDDTWNTTVWNRYATNALLGQMYLHIGDYASALENFDPILNYKTTDADYQYRFGVTSDYGFDSWKGIFAGVNQLEHIYTLWFGKRNASWQRNNMQYYFSLLQPNTYAIKPTEKCIKNWETIWRDYKITFQPQLPELATTENQPGEPGDFYRGYGVSYLYYKDGEEMTNEEVREMLDLKRLGKWQEVDALMAGVDTVAYKYSLFKDPFRKDAHFNVFRAAGIHLYAAEIYLWMEQELGSNMKKFDQFLYNGDYLTYRDDRLGVAGRVGLDFLELNPKLGIESSTIFKRDPYTNMVTGYMIKDASERKFYYQDNVLLNEKARELAFEGERFYDLVRVARRYNKLGIDGGEWLGNIIANKFPGSQKDEIKVRLSNPENWYLPFVLK